MFAAYEHVEVEATWGTYQRMMAAYRDPDRTAGKTAMQMLIAARAAASDEHSHSFQPSAAR